MYVARPNPDVRIVIPGLKDCVPLFSADIKDTTGVLKENTSDSVFDHAEPEVTTSRMIENWIPWVVLLITAVPDAQSVCSHEVPPILKCMLYFRNI